MFIKNSIANLPPTTGKIIFVDSNASRAAATNVGRDPEVPMSTIDAAVARCTANKGDIIVVAPGHTETVTAAGGLDLDVAGITLIGLGSGSSRPTINFTTAVGADMDVDAANITMKNFLFTGGIDALTGPIDVNAADFSLLDCETRDVTGQATFFIVTDANADRMLIDNWVHAGSSADGPDAALEIIGGDRITVRNFWIHGNFDLGAIYNVTTASTLLSIYGDKQCYIHTRGAEDLAINLVATSTGNVGPNINIRLADDAANVTECVAGADMQIFNPIRIVNADGESSLDSNITATVDEA